MNRNSISDVLDLLSEKTVSEAAAKSRSGVSAKIKAGAAIAAAAVLILGGTAAAAGSGLIDVKNIFGTVTGMEYSGDATGDISVEFLGFNDDGTLNLALTLNNADEPLYREIANGASVIKPLSYKITTESGDIVTVSQKFLKEHPGAKLGERLYEWDSELSAEEIEEQVPEGYVFKEETVEFGGWTTGAPLEGQDLVGGQTPMDYVINKRAPLENPPLNALMIVYCKTYEDPKTGKEATIGYKQEWYRAAEAKGKLTATIESFLVESKADQPLELHGNWSATCEV